MKNVMYTVVTSELLRMNKECHYFHNNGNKLFKLGLISISFFIAAISFQSCNKENNPVVPEEPEILQEEDDIMPLSTNEFFFDKDSASAEVYCLNGYYFEHVLCLDYPYDCPEDFHRKQSDGKIYADGIMTEKFEWITVSHSYIREGYIEKHDKILVSVDKNDSGSQRKAVVLLKETNARAKIVVVQD